MTENMEELQLKWDRWKSVIEKNGLKVNMGKTKVMVSGEGGEQVISMIPLSGMWQQRESKLGVVYRMLEVGAWAM